MKLCHVNIFIIMYGKEIDRGYIPSRQFIILSIPRNLKILTCRAYRQIYTEYKKNKICRLNHQMTISYQRTSNNRKGSWVESKDKFKRKSAALPYIII